MTALTGQVGELRLTLEVTRAATGETETFEMIGFADPEALKAALAEQQHAQGDDPDGR